MFYIFQTYKLYFCWQNRNLFFTYMIYIWNKQVHLSHLCAFNSEIYPFVLTYALLSKWDDNAERKKGNVKKLHSKRISCIDDKIGAKKRRGGKELFFTKEDPVPVAGRKTRGRLIDTGKNKGQEAARRSRPRTRLPGQRGDPDVSDCDAFHSEQHFIHAQIRPVR